LRIDGAGGGAPELMKIERAAPIGAALADYTSLVCAISAREPGRRRLVPARRS